MSCSGPPLTDPMMMLCRASLEGVSLSLVRWFPEVRSLHEIRGIEEDANFQVDSCRSLLKRAVTISAEVTLPYIESITTAATADRGEHFASQPIDVSIRTTSVHVLLEQSALRSLSDVGKAARHPLVPRTKSISPTETQQKPSAEDTSTRTKPKRSLSIFGTFPLVELEVLCDEPDSRHTSSSLSLSVAGVSVRTRSDNHSKSGSATVANITSHFRHADESVSNMVTWPEEQRLAASDNEGKPIVRVSWKSTFGQRSTSTIEVASFNILVPMEAVIFCRSLARSFPKATSTAEVKVRKKQTHVVFSPL